MHSRRKDKELTGTRKWDHICPILSSLGWLPVQYRIDFKLLGLVYKSLNGSASSYLSELLLVHKPARSLRSSDHSIWIIQRTKCKRGGDWAFAVWLQKDRTVFPHIRVGPTLNIFKRRLKAHFLCWAFETAVCWGIGLCLYCPWCFIRCYVTVVFYLWNHFYYCTALWSTLCCFNSALYMNKWNEIKAVVKNVSIIDITVNKCHATPPVFPCFSFKLRCSYWNTVKIFIHAFLTQSLLYIVLMKYSLHKPDVNLFIWIVHIQIVSKRMQCLKFKTEHSFFLYFRSLRFGTSCGWDFILWDRCSGVMMCAVRITPPTATPSPHFSMPSEACYALHSQSLWWPYPPTSYRYD